MIYPERLPSRRALESCARQIIARARTGQSVFIPATGLEPTYFKEAPGRSELRELVGEVLSSYGVRELPHHTLLVDDQALTRAEESEVNLIASILYGASTPVCGDVVLLFDVMDMRERA